MLNSGCIDDAGNTCWVETVGNFQDKVIQGGILAVVIIDAVTNLQLMSSTQTGDENGTYQFTIPISHTGTCTLDCTHQHLLTGKVTVDVRESEIFLISTDPCLVQAINNTTISIN
jgi:hypothetical protein